MTSVAAARTNDLEGSPDLRGVFIAGYVLLWLLEGALRKWVPGASTPFYIARDGYALLVLGWLALNSNRPVPRLPWWVAPMLALGVLWAGVEFLHTDNEPAIVFLFGMRSYLGPLLFALLCFKFGTGAALQKSTALLVWAAPVQLILTVVQVVSAPSAFINVQVGGAENDFRNSADVVRATGTFSSPLGLNLYLLAAVVVALWWTTTRSTRTWGWIAVVCLLATCALSGARGSVLYCSIVLIVYLAHAIANPTLSSLQRVGILLLLLAVSVIAVRSTLPDVVDAFVIRFNNASVSENSSDRLFDSASRYLFQPIGAIGDGVGTHSNAGIALGSSSNWIENDNLRWVAELGIVGYLISSLRTVLAVVLAARVVIGIRTIPVPQLLLTTGLAVLLAIGSVNETPTSEGGFGILLGLMVLLARRPEATMESAVDGRSALVGAAARFPTVRSAR